MRSGRRGGDGRLSSRPSGVVPPATGSSGLQRIPGSARGPHLLLVPPGPPRPCPLLVYFHGAGGRAEQGLPLLRDVAAERGLLVLLPTSAAATWDLLLGRVGPDADALDDALGAVFADRPVERVAFAGFSDGASYALSLGLANGDLAEAVLAFSPGFADPQQQVGTPRVWLSHGTVDAVLPIARCGRRVARLLGQAGYDFRYEEFDGGHVVLPGLVGDALEWWLGRQS